MCRLIGYPKKSLASIIAVEAQILSQAQAAEVMLGYDNNCLHLDGNKKRFTEYGGFQISTEAGSFSLSHKVMPPGYADSYLQATKETFSELAESLSEENNEKNKLEAKLLMCVKSIMTDRHTVNKRYKKLLEKEKETKIDVLGIEMTEEERDSACSVNGLFCGLHILPNMATAAFKGLQNFEKDNNISKEDFFDNNSVANSFIYEVTKAFIETSGCHKSGDGLEFNDFLSEKNEKNYLITFLHNRFNVLFIDGGAVFYHKKHILEYLESGRCSKSNKLLKSIQNRIKNETLLAECRALGIIGKLICGPLWRILEDQSISFFEMNDYWQILVEKFEEFSNDPTSLIKGDCILDNEHLITKDPVYETLFQTNIAFDEMTKNALTAICKHICPMLKRQLVDQLPGGKYYIPKNDIKTQCVPVPKTNRISEADFSALDRLEKNAPQTSTLAKSGIINYTNNKTSTFLNQISRDKRKKYFTLARRAALKRSRGDKHRKSCLRQHRLNIQQDRIEKKHRKEERTNLYCQKLETQAKKEGIWVTTEEAESKTSQVNNTKKRQLIRNQILFHSKLLKSKIPTKSLIKFQENKKQIQTEKMLSNLKTIIIANYEHEVPEFVLNINNAVPSNSGKTKRPFQSKQRKRQNNTCKRVKNRTEASSSEDKQNSIVTVDKYKFYAIAFTDRWYPGLCTEVIDEQTAFFDFLHPSGKHFKWPHKTEKQRIHLAGILCEIFVEPVSNGKLFVVNEQDLVDKLFI